MTIGRAVLAPPFAEEAAAWIAAALPAAGSAVITGGTTASAIYGATARLPERLWSLDLFFSDERCVPPNDEHSNYAMATRALFGDREHPRLHRMRGEDEPAVAAARYHDEIAPRVERGIDFAVLGMGADCHIAAMFPGSPALKETSRLCVDVQRPDGMGGLTLTPPALLSARKICVAVSGAGKADAVGRAVAGQEPVEACPVRLLADHPDVTFLLDDAAATSLAEDGP